MARGGVMRLRPNPWKQTVLILICAGFLALGGFLVSQGDAFGWLCVAFFGAGLLVFLLGLLPGSSYLEFRRDGFEMSSLYRKWFVRWSDVQSFFPHRIASNRMVCWNCVPDHQGHASGHRLSARLTGVEAALPETYGRSADELADLMNQWRLRHRIAGDQA